VRPQLSVVTQPAYEIGRAAAELLVSAGDHRAPRHLVLSPTLVVRESSRRAGG
jgi:DNA-binding LacI/PurR family transcriptional regulator